MEEEIKIVVLGDPGVGKTSLILNIVTEKFNPNPPKYLNRIGISDEIFAPSRDHGMTYLIDFNEENAEGILRDADAVCLCHSITDMANPEKLFESAERWLSFIRLQAHKSPPVILVGTKADLPANHNSWEKKCRDLMTRYPEVASAIKCSAKKNLDVLNVFVSAQKCAIYPICPVFNARTGKLTAQAAEAIKRIFYIADGNFDKVMEKGELSELQRLVFGSPLNDKGYDDICTLIRDSHHRAVNKNGIEKDGFIALQAKLCSNLKQEVVWTMMKAYGYQLKNGEIRLRDIASNHDFTEKVDFTEKTIDFLTKIFKASLSDPARDALSRRDLEERLFRPIGHLPDDFDPSVPLTPVITQVNTDGEIFEFLDLASFLTRWYILLLRDAHRAVSLIFELGFCQSLNGLGRNTARCSDTEIFNMIVQPQPSLLKRRYIFFGVTGNQYVGKTTILKSVSRNKTKKMLSNWSARAVTLDKSMSQVQKFLIFEEQSYDDFRLGENDVTLACYSHTDPDSIASLWNLFNDTNGDEAPRNCILVRTHCDLSSSNVCDTKLLEKFNEYYCIKDEIMELSRKLPENTLNKVLCDLTKTILKYNGQREHQWQFSSTNLHMASISACLLGFLLYRYFRR